MTARQRILALRFLEKQKKNPEFAKKIGVKIKEKGENDMGFLSDLFKSSFESWLESATDEELADTYEDKRQEWIKNGCGGNGERTSEMKSIDKEMSKRSAEKWENDPRRNRDPNFRWTDENRWEK